MLPRSFSRPPRPQRLSSFSQALAVAFQAAKQRPTPSSEESASDFQEAMQPPSSSSQVSESAVAFQGAPAHRPPLPPQAPPPPRFGADGPPRPAAPSRRSLNLRHPQPPYSGVQETKSMDEQAPWETLDPLSHEAPGGDFSMAYSVSDEELLHRSNFDSMEQERYYTNLINDESNHLESSEMGSQYADEQDPIGNENVVVRPNQKRSKNFSLEEDNLLVSVWINVSFDAVLGTDQSHGTYWGRIYEYFHDNKEFDSDRSQSSLVHRWSAIQEQVNKYTGYLCQIQNRNQSGVNPEDMHVQAAMLYKNKEKKKFQFMHCYNVLKNLPKWHTKRTQLAASKTSNKKQKKTDNSTPAMCTPACNADESEAAADPENTEGEGRPIGRKKAKQQIRECSDQSRKESLDYLWNKKKEADAEKERKLEERYKIAFTLEQQRIDLEKKQV